MEGPGAPDSFPVAIDVSVTKLPWCPAAAAVQHHPSFVESSNLSLYTCLSPSRLLIVVVVVAGPSTGRWGVQLASVYIAYLVRETMALAQEFVVVCFRLAELPLFLLHLNS